MSVTQWPCHTVTSGVTNDVTRCVQSQSQTQSQNPFLYLTSASCSITFATQLQTARGKRDSKRIHDTTQRPSKRPPTDTYRSAREGIAR